MAKVKSTTTPSPVDEPWFNVAWADLGTKEGPGNANNPKVVQYYKDCGHDEVEYDSVAWCAGFVGSSLKRAGYPTTPVATNLMARSYCTYGTALDEPKPGCIAVLKRGAPPQGHVGFLLEAKGKTIKLLAGNQGDAVSIATFPRDQVIAWRWPVEPTLAGLKKAGSSDIANADGTQNGVLITGAVTAAGAALSPTAANPVPVPLLPSADQLQKASDNAGITQTLFDAMTTIGHTLRDNPWIVGLIIGGGIIWYYARKGKLKRLERLLQGQPLSSEA